MNLTKEIEKRMKKLSYNYESGKWYSARVFTDPKDIGNYMEIWVTMKDSNSEIVGAFKPEIIKNIKKGDSVQVQIYESAGGNIKRIEKIKK